MKPWRVVTALAVISSIAISCGGTRHPATITEETQTIKTYSFSDPDPVPILARSRNKAIYPYFRFDGFSSEGRDQIWKVVKLENDFIQVFVLPEVGGKIWGAIEKSTGRDFIYRNEVMKFRDVAMRGPWTSGGIEFNFGLIGHTPATATPVDYVLQEDADGSVSCIVGSIDLPSRTQWRVRIRLPKDSAAFETTSFWYNPTPLHQSYYHWMNAAVHAREDLQFYYPGEYYIGHGGDAHPWPVNENGIDLSLYRNHHFGGNKSLHVLGGHEEFSGGYWHDLDFGFGHWSRYDDMPGRKIWIWSLARSGAIWEDLLTDHNGQYVEVQAGRQLSQATLVSGENTPFTQAAFLPYASDTWRELWFPVREIGGIVHADPDGALNVTRNGDKTIIAFNALRPIRSEIAVAAGGKSVLQESLNLSPMQVFKKEVTIPSAEKEIEVSIGGRAVWGVASDPHSQLVFSRSVNPPPEKANSTAGKAYFMGRQSELMRDYVKALEHYGLCLNEDPLHIPALVRMAEIRYRLLDYGRALTLAGKALAIDTYDPGANFVAGAALKDSGSPDAALEALAWAARSPEYRSAAYTLMAEIHLNSADFEDTVDYADKALDFNRLNIPALSAKAVALRKLDRKQQAAQVQRGILAMDPLNHLAVAESWFLNPSEATQKAITSTIRSELPQESFLELAAFYHRNGRVQEAVQVLRLSPSHPIVDYWLAYLIRDENPVDSRALLEKARQASPRLIFPFRVETVPVLEWALTQARDWKTLYYLGLIAWSKGREPEAVDLLVECGDRSDYGPFYLARAGLSGTRAELSLPRTALPITLAGYGIRLDYEKALSLAPDQWRSWLAKARLEGFPSDLTREAFERFPDNFMLGMEYARALINAKQYEGALQVLERLVVLPYENASEGRMLYEKAHLLAAGEDIQGRKYEEALGHIAGSREWPEHLGVGRPYDPDERLQDYLEDYCNGRLGRTGSIALSPAAVDSLRAALKRQNSWKYELMALIPR